MTSCESLRDETWTVRKTPSYWSNSVSCRDVETHNQIVSTVLQCCLLMSDIIDNNTPSTVGSRLSGGDSEKKQQENEPSEDVSSRTSCCKANIDDPECDEHHLNPVFKTMVPDYTQNVKMVEMVPGKGPPPEPPLDCCMSGCPSCLWINYAEELKDYYHDGDERALSAIEKIDNVSLRTFIKLELGYL
ncbi:hypothetical protein ScPMuIL_003759 [Solemya velum]